MKKKIIVSSFVLLTLSILFFGLSYSSQEKSDSINRQIELAIEEAAAAGDYRCCIRPACTMCYLEANQWNNHKAGTCACDDLISQGQDPCPQCRRGYCRADSECSL
ncbi:MAG: hypothetical protein ABIB61_03685 [Candidatus Shapirobacteria bacterium]